MYCYFIALYNFNGFYYRAVTRCIVGLFFRVRKISVQFVSVNSPRHCDPFTFVNMRFVVLVLEIHLILIAWNHSRLNELSIHKYRNNFQIIHYI